MSNDHSQSRLRIDAPVGWSTGLSCVGGETGSTQTHGLLEAREILLMLLEGFLAEPDGHHGSLVPPTDLLIEGFEEACDGPSTLGNTVVLRWYKNINRQCVSALLDEVHLFAFHQSDDPVGGESWKR